MKNYYNIFFRNIAANFKCKLGVSIIRAFPNIRVPNF